MFAAQAKQLFSVACPAAQDVVWTDLEPIGDGMRQAVWGFRYRLPGDDTLREMTEDELRRAYYQTPEGRARMASYR